MMTSVRLNQSSFCHCYHHAQGWDSSIGAATRYGMNGLGIESRWGARFSITVHTGPWAHPASYAMGTGSYPGLNWPGLGVYHPPPSSAEVKM